MPNKIFNIRLRNKRDTEANWEKKDPLILDGETIVVTTASGETRVKIGDGAKNYTQLPFLDEVLKNEINNKAAIDAGVYTAVASSSDGVAYTATVPGIESLSSGASFIMIPDKTSASKEPTIDVNGLGAKKIRRRLSAITTSLQSGYSNTWISINKPFQIVYDGATWVGWYSDAACTDLVSTDQNYSINPTSDLTLYAKATHDAELFTCAAVAGANISSVNISDSTVPANGSCTFSAMANAGCAFEGWYSDESCTNLVSTENPYTATIIANTTLYAKAHIINFNISVGQSEYGSADVNTSIAQYGDNVTFIATPSSQRYDFFGWYADAAYTNLVSLDNPYNCTVTTDIKLYPKFGLKNYNLIVHPTGYDKINFNGVTNIENVEILYKNSSKETSTDTVAIWAIGELNKSDNPASVGFFVDGAKFSSIPTNATITNINVFMKVKADGNTGASITSNTSRGFYTAKKEINGDSFSYAQIGTTKYKDVVIKLNEDSEYSYYLTYTISNEEAGKWTAADLKSGSFGIVWLVSSPSITSNDGVCKHLIHNIDISVSYTLPEEYTTSTALYFRSNGSYKSVARVYKKVSGAWVEQTDVASLFDGTASGNSTNYVYGGSV
jgi:hypothetical protein